VEVLYINYELSLKSDGLKLFSKKKPMGDCLLNQRQPIKTAEIGILMAHFFGFLF
jgi:hypothetical protein